MNTLTTMDWDDMVTGAKCIVVYGNKPSDMEEAEIIDLRFTQRMSSWTSTWRVHVRFADGVELDYSPKDIKNIS